MVHLVVSIFGWPQVAKLVASFSPSLLKKQQKIINPLENDVIRKSLVLIGGFPILLQNADA